MRPTAVSRQILPKALQVAPRRAGHAPPRVRFNSTRAGGGTPFWNGPKIAILTIATATVSYLTSSAIHVSRVGKNAAKAASEKPQYAAKPTLELAVQELQASLGLDAISTDDEDLHRHGFSEWSSCNSDVLPIAIAYPRSTADVSRIAQVCSKYRIPMIPFSGGTSLEGNFSAPYGGVCIDFAYMDQVLKVHQEDMDVVVQPSVPWMQLNDKLKSTGLWFPVDPGPTAQIGGMVGTSCSGTNAVRYGTMRDWVMNLTVVLADGTVIKTKRRPRKTAAGYNLNHVFVGSEGTLGLVTEITLKLTPIPEETTIVVATFPSIKSAASAASAIMRKGIQVGALELMDEIQMRTINLSKLTKRTWDETPTLMMKLSGTTKSCVENADQVRSICKEAARQGQKDEAGVQGAQSQPASRSVVQDEPTSLLEAALAISPDKSSFQHKFIFATDVQEKEEVWAARKNALWSMLALRNADGTGPQQVISTDVAVPFSHLPGLIEETKADLVSLGLYASALGHIGDGNFHTSILYDKTDPEQQDKVDKCVKRMVKRALEMDGTCTGEHGIGMGKKDKLLEEVGPEVVGVMKQLKKSLDPHWLLNPGKVFDF